MFTPLIRSCLLSLLLWLCLVTACLSQPVGFTFYNTSDGLSGNFTQNVIQDRLGFIWALNDYKLHRFDGKKFIPAPSLPSGLSESQGLILDTYALKDSLFLVKTKKEFYLLDPITWSGRSLETPESIHKLIAFTDRNFNHQYFIDFQGFSERTDIWRLDDHRFHKVNTPAINWQVNSLLCIDVQANMYYSDGDQLQKIDSSGRLSRQLDLEDAFPGKNLTFLNQANNNQLGIMVVNEQSSYELYFVDTAFQHIQIHPSSRFLSTTGELISSFNFQPDGSYFACGINQTLLYYSAELDTLYNLSPKLRKFLPDRDDMIYPIFDQTGSTWIPTRLGLLKVDLKLPVIDQYFATSSEDCSGYCSFRGFTEDDQGLIYAQYYWGLVCLDPHQKKELYSLGPEYQLPMPSQPATAPGGIWLNNGSLFDPITGNRQAVAGSGEKPYEEGLFATGPDQSLWWVYFDKVHRLDASTQPGRWEVKYRIPQEDLELVPTTAFFISPSGRQIWVAQRGRLCRIDQQTGTGEWIDWDRQQANPTQLLALEEDQQGKLWIATDIGLLYFNPLSKQIEAHYTTADGLANDFICGLISEGDSCLWLSTNYGLSRFRIADESWNNFYEEDGLTHNEFNRKSYFKARDGRLFFGGLRGINAFYPEELIHAYRPQNQSAQVVLHTFAYTDEQQDTTIQSLFPTTKSSIHLYHGSRSFKFGYVLTDYRNPQAVRYSYKMDGYERNWSPPSEFKFAQFSSLPPGDYVFRVKASDSRGIWHPSQLAVPLTVHPPWWLTWWAYLGYGLLILGGTLLILRFLSRRWKLRRELEMEQREATRLKELDTLKSRLYTNLTHEFRTPLTVILGMVNHLKGQSRENWEESIQLIDRNGRNLLRLVNQLLDLSKLENQSFQLKLQQADIVPFLSYTTQSFQSYANGQNLSLQFVTTLESLMMDYDPEQVQQIMTNLLSNAIKFTPSGGAVTVRLHQVEDKLRIEVKDTGIGIAPQDQPRIFDRFYQVDDSTTRAGEGTGIGLAHAQELVRLMGGAIQVESQLNQGTCFTIVLPIRQEAVMVDAESAINPAFPDLPYSLGVNAVEPPSTIDAHKPQVLIIEDNPDVVTYLKSCLHTNYALDIAYNGQFGIEKAVDAIPDIIISDVMMPGKDGFEVCEALKNDERTSHIPIILLTAKADAASRIAGLRRGADAYLAKPFAKEELLVRLAMLTERQKRLAVYFSTTNDHQESPDAEDDLFQIENAFLQKVIHIIDKHYTDEDFGLLQLCRQLGMSRSQLFRKLKAITGTPPSEFIRNYRLEAAQQLLQSTELTVAEVAYRVGYKDPAHFSKSYHQAFGHPPSEATKKQDRPAD